MSEVITRVFMNGNSQAVRIPQEFRLDASRVRISREADGALLIRPIPADRGSKLLEALQAFDDEVGAEFIAQLEADRAAQLPDQDRGPLP